MSVDPAYMDAPPENQGFLQKKIGPLPVWAIGAAGILVIGYIWYKNRQSSGAGMYSGTSATDAVGAVPTTDYGQGFDYGYAAGLNSTGSTDAAEDSSEGGSTNSGGGTKPPLQHTRYCWEETDPAGVKKRVCSFGHWQRRNGDWHWIVGAPKGGRNDGSKGAQHLPVRNPHNPFRKMSALPQGQQIPYATV